MAETFNGSVSILVDATLSGGLDIGTGTHKVNSNYKTSFANGTAANQANMMWTDTRTVALSTSDDLDLAGGLVSAFGTTVTFTSIKGIIIHAASANGANLSIGGDATAAFSTLFNAATDEILLAPGGTLAVVNPNADGYVVTATTADILEITNLDGAASADYDIIIIGEV